MVASGEQLLKWASQFTLEHLKSAGIRAEARANKRKERLASHYVKRANKRRKAGEADKEYLIESILGQRGDADELEYLVRWDGYSQWKRDALGVVDPSPHRISLVVGPP